PSSQSGGSKVWACRTPGPSITATAIMSAVSRICAFRTPKCVLIVTPPSHVGSGPPKRWRPSSIQASGGEAYWKVDQPAYAIVAPVTVTDEGKHRSGVWILLEG